MKKIVSVMLCIAMLFGLTACGSDSGTTEAAASTAAPTSEAATQGGEEKHYKEKIVIALDYAITTTDPVPEANYSHNIMFYMSHNRLVYLDSANVEIKPELAKEWTWVNDKQLDFTLRDDVYFQNGEHMTSEDVKYSFDLQIENGTTYFAPVEKVETDGDYKVSLYLKEPSVDLLFQLSYPIGSIICKKACEADEANRKIGTGPYKITELVESDHVDLERWDEWWGDELPKTKYFTIRYIPEDSARLIALQNKEIDVCFQVSKNELEYVEEDPDIELIQSPSSSLVYLAFDTSEAPCDDINLRLAVAYALNIDDIITVAANGYGTPTTTHWGVATPYKNESIPTREQNLELAKEYADKATVKEFTITTAGNERETVATLIQEQCRKVGITVNVNTVETATLSSMSAFDTHEHEACVYNFGWREYADDISRPFSVGNNVNKAICTDERVQELIVLGRSTTDEAKRAEYYGEIQQINYDTVYYIPVYFQAQFAGVTKGLQGVVWNASKSHVFTYCYIEE